MLEEAVRKDPTFLLAYCLLAKAHDDLYHWGLDKTPERRALADAAVDEAVKLDPTNPDVHLTVAYHRCESYQDYERAKAEVALAEQALPNSSEAFWLAALEGKHPTMEASGFAAVRDQLEQRVVAHPEDVDLLGVLGTIDAFLGHKSEAIEEATRAMKLVDALAKDFIRESLAIVYARTNEPDQAFQELAVLVKGLDSRGVEDLKAQTEFDPIRNDPRFDQLGTPHQ